MIWPWPQIIPIGVHYLGPGFKIMPFGVHYFALAPNNPWSIYVIRSRGRVHDEAQGIYAISGRSNYVTSDWGGRGHLRNQRQEAIM